MAQIVPPRGQHERLPGEQIRGLNSRGWSPLPNLLTTASPSAFGKRPGEETEGFSKTPRPRDKVQQFQASQVQECSSRVPSWGQSSQASPLPSCGCRSPAAGCASCSCSQTSADAPQPCAPLPGAVTPPAGAGPVPVRPRNGRRRLAPRAGSSAFKKAMTKEPQSLGSGACHQWSCFGVNRTSLRCAAVSL